MSARPGIEPDTARDAGARPDLSAAVVQYWNARIHDLEMTTRPPGSAEFFKDLEAYRFEKLDYLPHRVDFSGYRGRKVLEIGCGIGTDLVRFARGGARVTGVDLSSTAIELARQNFGHESLEADLRVADGTALPFPPESFDLVYAHGVLQYSADPRGIVLEASRVLAPDGEAIFMVYNRRSWLAWMSRRFGVGLEHGDAPAFRLYSIPEFESLLDVFPARRIVPERFPVRTRLHHGAKGVLYNWILVPAFRAVPRTITKPLGWHLMAYCRKQVRETRAAGKQ